MSRAYINKQFLFNTCEGNDFLYRPIALSFTHQPAHLNQFPRMHNAEGICTCIKRFIAIFTHALPEHSGDLCTSRAK